MATTSILPLTLGQAVLGRATEPDAPPPEYLRIDGECWKLVTDPAAIEAAQAALEARERADSAFAMAQYAPRIANRPPALSDAEGKAPGAGWLEYDPATQLLKQMWRWTGAAWEELPMDPVMVPVIQIGTGTAGDLTADRLIVTSEFVARVAQILELSVENLVVTEGATINELVALAIAGATAEFQQAYIQNLRSNGAEIDEAVIGVLASNIITSGLFRTADAGQRLEIDSNGLVMYGVDPDGADYELVRIGPSGENLITLGDTTVSPTGVQTPSGTFGELAVAGEDLATILDRLPKGVVARGTVLETLGRSVTNGEVELGELRVPVEPGRSYRLTVEPVSVYAPALSYAQLRIHWTQGGESGAPSPTLSSEIVRYITSRRTGSTGRDEMIQLGGAFSIQSGEAEELRFLFGLYSDGTASLFDSVNGGVLRAIMEDIGPRSPDIMTNRTGSDSNPVPPPPAKRSYTKTYNSNGYRCYNVNDRSDAGRPDVVHGLYSGGPSRFNRMGGWTFPSMTGDLSGATVEKVEMYIHCNQTYSSLGATVNPAVWGGVMANTLSTFTSVYGWKAGQGKWITLPSNLYAGFKSGAYAGIGVRPTSTSSAQYARFAPTGAKLKITFVK